VTGSRLEAVRYKQSFDGYIQEKGYATFLSDATVAATGRRAATKEGMGRSPSRAGSASEPAGGRSES
jgi:hypothetical protein